MKEQILKPKGYFLKAIRHCFASITYLNIYSIIMIILLLNFFYFLNGAYSADHNQNDPVVKKPWKVVEEIMPSIGDDEISVVLMGPINDPTEKKIYDYFNSPRFDYFIQAQNVFEVIPKLAEITKSSGKKI